MCDMVNREPVVYNFNMNGARIVAVIPYEMSCAWREIADEMEKNVLY